MFLNLAFQINLFSDQVLNIAVFDDLRSSADATKGDLYGIATFPSDDNALTSTGGLSLNKYVMGGVVM